MLFSHNLVIIRGGGDLATGVAYRLHKAGFPLIITELPQPLVVRRTVALATAVLQGEITVEDLHARLVADLQEALNLAFTGTTIPILVAPNIDPLISNLEILRSEDYAQNDESQVSSLQFPVSNNPQSPISVLIDARMAKRNIDTHIDQALLVVALGPGFTAGVDCHAVVETKRGHRLGRVIWDGAALPNTGTPGMVAGKGKERVLRAPVAGRVDWRLEIGDLVEADELLGVVDGNEIRAPFDGVVRGLIAPGTQVPKGLKIGDVDARGDPSACYLMSDKALAIGGGVLEAILTYLNQARR